MIATRPMNPIWALRLFRAKALGHELWFPVRRGQISGIAGKEDLLGRAQEEFLGPVAAAVLYRNDLLFLVGKGASA